MPVLSFSSERASPERLWNRMREELCEKLDGVISVAGSSYERESFSIHRNRVLCAYNMRDAEALKRELLELTYYAENMLDDPLVAASPLPHEIYASLFETCQKYRKLPLFTR